MDKNKLHHYWRLLNNRSWPLLALALVAGVTFILSYRHNNVVSLELATAVTKADKINGQVNTPQSNTVLYDVALKKLRQHIFTHMNAGLGTVNGVQQPIQLKYTYDRRVADELAKTDATSNIYNEAQIYCERTQPVGLFGANRLTCIREYIDTHNPDTPKKINENEYKYDFVSPRWSPDMAGWSLVVFVVSGTAYVISQISRYLLKRAID